MYTSGLSGGSFAIYEHALRFMRKGHAVQIIYLHDRADLATFGYPGQDEIPARHLCDLDSEQEFDVAIATWWETAYHIHKIPAKHYAYFIQDLEYRFYEEPFRTYRLLVEKTYDEHFHFFASSRFLADYVSERNGQEVVHIPYSLNFERFEKAVPVLPQTDKLRVLVEGPGAQPRKRIDLTFDALREFEGIEVVYVASDGFRKDSWRVDHFFERVPYTDMPGIIASCDVILKLSSQESFALPVLETFACGGTAIVSAFTGHDEYIEHEENALVVPLDDKEAAVSALRRILESPDLLAKLKNGANETCDRFSWAASNDLFEKRLLAVCAPASKDQGPLTVLNDYQDAYADYLYVLDRLNYFKKQFSDIYQSTTWKAGCAVLSPLRYMKLKFGKST